MLKVRNKWEYSPPRPEELARDGVFVRKVDGDFFVTVGTRAFHGAIYTFDPYDDLPWKKAVKAMYESGVRIFSFLAPLPIAWKPDGSFDFSELDKLHQDILTIAPDALLMPRVFMNTPEWWDRQNPEELIRFDGMTPKIEKFPKEHQKLWQYETKMYHGIDNASKASDKWKHDAGKALAEYVRFTTNKYPGNFMGFIVAYGTCGEWGEFGSYKYGQFGSFDFSLPMQNKFRNFLKSKYGTDNSLQAAWKDRACTLNSAMPPRKYERLEVEVGCLKEPGKCQRYVDFLTFHGLLTASVIDYLCGKIKGAAVHPVLAGSFGGGGVSVGMSAYITHNALHAFASKPLLECDNLDFISTPNSYCDRINGIFSQAAIASVSSQKLFIAECDCRTHVANDIYSPQTPEDSLNMFVRDTGHNIIHGNGWFWWYDFGKGWYLNNKKLSLAIHAINHHLVTNTRKSSKQAEVAVVIDNKSVAFSEGMTGYYRMFNELLNLTLPHSGAPFDIIFSEDILDRDPYKLYIFRDMFYIESGECRKLRKFFEDNNSSCLWFYAAGCITDKGIDFKNASKLTGIQIKPLPNIISSNSVTLFDDKHPLMNGIETPKALNEVENINTVWTPVIQALPEPDVDIIGQIESVGKPGLACRMKSERIDVWAASPKLSIRFLRNLFLKTGVSIRVPEDVMIFGSGQTLLLKSDYNRSIQLSVPDESRLGRNIITGKEYPVKDGTIDLKMVKGRCYLISLEG